MLLDDKTRRLCKERTGVDPEESYRRMIVQIKEGGSAYERILNTISTYEPKVKPSPRQIEVMRLVANGYTSKEIGKQLFISQETVKTAISQVGKKLHTRNRTHSAILCLLLGYFNEGQ